MAIFRSRAVDAANQAETLDTPLVLLRPQLRQRFNSNLRLWRDLSIPQNSNHQVWTEEQIQHDPTECAAVSLSIILRYHGSYQPISTIRHACGVSRDGSNAANLVCAARTFGMNAKGYKKGLKTLQTVSLPAVVFWNFDHFLVLEGIDEQRFWINDPATGRRCVELEEFDRCYTGVVITMQPDPSFEPTGKAPQAVQHLGAWLKRGSKDKRWGFLLMLGISAGVLSQTTRVLVEPGLWPFIGLALAVVPLGQVLSRELERQLRRELQEQLISLPDWILQQHFSHELAGRLERVSALCEQLRLRLGQSLPLVLGMAVWTVVLLVQNTVLGLIVIGGLSLWTAVKQRNESMNSSRDVRSRISMNSAGLTLQAGLKDPETLKASALEQDLFLRWSGLDAIATRQRQNLSYSRELQDWVPQIVYWSLPVLVWSVASHTANAGLTVIVGTMGLCLALQQLQEMWKAWGASKRAILAIRDLQEQPRDPLLSAGQHQSNIPFETGPASVSVEGVDFGYIPVLPPLIQELSLSVDKGQKIALVGGSGSGKSTLARLMAGLVQPNKGVVKINGIPLLEMTQQERSQAIAMLQQGMPLFSATVRDNLTLFNSAISDGEIQAACETAAIWERLQQLPQGLNTTLGVNGQDLSGGEQQRLQLAQVLLQRPSLLILDEATSALDAQTEARIEQAIQGLHCTQIVVAHRLSTVRDADVIIVLDHGKIVQRGCHDALLKEEGSHYCNLLLLEDANL